MAANVASFLANARGPTAAAAKIISLDEVRSRRGSVDTATAESWSLEALRGRLTELSASGAVGTLSAAMELVLEAQLQGETVAWIARACTFGGVGGVVAEVEAVDEYWSEPAAAAAGGMVAPAVGSRARGVSRVPTDLLGASADGDPRARPALAERASQTSGAGRSGSAGGCFYPPDLIDSGIDLAALVVVRAPDVKAMARAAERMLRSGGFGLVLMDLVEETVAADLLGGADGAPRARAARLEHEFSMAHQGRLVSLAQAHDAAIVCLTEKSADTASLGSLVSLRVEALHVHLPKLGTHEYELSLRALKDKRRGPGWSAKFRRRGPSGL